MSKRWRIGVGLIIAGLVIAIGWSFSQSPPADRAAAGPAPPCPYGFVDRPSETAPVLQRLRTTTDGAAVLAALGQTEVRFCWGEIANPVVQEGRLLLMSTADAPPQRAARAAHLLHHAAHGLPLPDSIDADADCGALVAQALRREAEAYALEVQLRRRLGAEDTRYEFEPVFFETDPADQVALIEGYLRAHPDGAENLEPLARGYRERCEAAVAEAR